jgi:hypothetical protein
MSLFGGEHHDLLSTMLTKLKSEVPDAIYRHATQQNLADTALAAVIQHAVSSFAASLIPGGALGGALGAKASSLLGGVSSLFGAAESLGVGHLIQKALDSTDVDEQLRDALIDGFSRYLRDNAGHLAKVALQAISTGLSKSQG